MKKDFGIWDQTREEKIAEEIERKRLLGRSILECLQDQFDELKKDNIFEAVQHNIS